MIGCGANFESWAWGRGLARSAADGVGGGSAPIDGAEKLTEDDFRGWSAEQGLDNLRGDFAEVKPDLSDLAGLDFPGPIAEAAFYDDNAIVGIQGPVGSGKTTTVLYSRLRRAQAMPRSVIDGVRRYKLLVIRSTYRQLWSTTIPDFLSVFPKDLGNWSGGRGGPVTFVMRFSDDMGEIEFTAEFMAFGDDIVGSLRGFQVTDAWLHEFDTNPEDVLANVITRISRYPATKHFEGYPPEHRTYGQIVGDMNAMDRDNFAYKLFYDTERQAELEAELNSGLDEGTAPIRISFHRQPGYGEDGCENLQNLPPNYYQKQILGLKQLGRGDLIDRLVHNKVTYLRIGEPVFKREFSRALHVADRRLELLPNLGLRVGLDQGFLGAAVIGQFKPPFHWRILGVMFFPDERLHAREFGRRLREFIDERWPGEQVVGGWGDMAGEHGSSIAADENDTWNRIVGSQAGFRVMPQRVGTNRIQPRLEAVRAPLEYLLGGQPGLLIDPDCDALIAGFEARYVWADEIDASGDKRKVPNKKIAEANVMDALQYLLLSEHRGDGLSPITIPGAAQSLRRHNGGPPLGDIDGLQTGFDILNPYGG